jgi:uncharacterized membrane protein HdeD (DUF308 family)
MEAGATPPQPPPPPAAPATADYPIRFDVEYPDRLSRWKIFVKWLLAIPHLIILYLLQFVISVLVLIAFFAILFTKKWPRGMFDFAVQVQRWGLNVASYGFLLLRDEYPPFSGDSGQYPGTLEIDYDGNLSRWQIFLKWLFALPHYIVLLFLFIAAYVVIFIAFFAILFTGRYPRGMFDFVVGTIRWWMRVHSYSYLLMTDRYPPFSLK